MQNKLAKIMAILALVGIVASIIGTGAAIFIMGGDKDSNNKIQITKEEIEKIIKKAESESGATISPENTGTKILELGEVKISENNGDNTLSGEIEN